MAHSILSQSAKLLAFVAVSSWSFCGFYVAKADTKLFNKASKVVLVRDENKTVITMANDFEGDVSDFALVVPVPEVLKKEQIHVTENKFIDHLDAYTAPRLVEYFDEDPCMLRRVQEFAMMADASAPPSIRMKKSAKKLGVTIEAEYAIEEYDVMLLSGKESAGLLTWLNQEGYKLPKAAESVVSSYLKQGLFFFVAKVNVERASLRADQFLRPIQVAFESPKFSLPVRLGTVNSKGSQDLFVFALTKKGRVEATNYRTINIPTGQNIPVYVKNEFSPFYKDMFSQLVKREGMDKMYLEYAWDMGWCDPCAAGPLSKQELKNLGVFWETGEGDRVSRGQNVYVTRLHARYTSESFPADVQFQVTPNKTNYQGRYVLRHPWKGEGTCERATQYLEQLPKRFDKEAQNLSHLTGWSIDSIRTKMNYTPQKIVKKVPFWKKLWQ